jgi:glycosyltransferase involved in cell wall biosynthesis
VTSELVPVSVIVLTKDEELNLAACLESVRGWACEVIVVDSASTDRTVEIARRLGAEVVTHPFESHVTQWRWALSAIPIRSDWVLGLDADQRVTPELAAAIREFTASDRATRLAGAFVPRRQVFRGRWIRHGGYYPKHLLKLFRRDAVWFDDTELVDHHFRVRGETTTLVGDLVEDNAKDARIDDWISRHARYARLQAMEEVARARSDQPADDGWAGPDARTAARKRVWRRMPRYLRPLLYFFYRYVLRLGFLDGREGFVFHALQAFWYRLLVDIHIDEIRAATPAARRVEDRRTVA